MGYVYKPIPPDILRQMPPALRRQYIQEERARLLRMKASQGRLAGLGWGIMAVLVIMAAHYFYS